MSARRKRSISVPPELDTQIQAEATRDGTTYSGWLTKAAHKELRVRAGLKAVAEVEKELGVFSSDELVAADAWARDTIERSWRTAARPRRAA
jgi:hypothetical protein